MLAYFAVIVVATHAVAFGSWHLIEKPAMSLKDWCPPAAAPAGAVRPAGATAPHAAPAGRSARRRPRPSRPGPANATEESR